LEILKKKERGAEREREIEGEREREKEVFFNFIAILFKEIKKF
jgi:hypothetical protein